MYNEDTLVQTTTADYLQHALKWDESIYAMDEVFGKEGTLGRTHDGEVVLTRYLGEMLMRLNPGLPQEAYQDALRLIVGDSASSVLLATNRDKDRLHKNGVEVSFRNDKGQRIKKRLRLFDFDNPDNNHFLVVREFWIRGDLYIPPSCRHCGLREWHSAVVHGIEKSAQGHQGCLRAEPGRLQNHRAASVSSQCLHHFGQWRGC
jgi:type I site-specific restriction-modification system R (restriction) subunit